jgi:hypothetical protein
MFSKKNIGILLLSSLFLIVMLSWGFKKQKDPLWAETLNLLDENFLLVENASDSLTLLSAETGNRKNPDAADLLALKFISTPFPPTMTFQKFKLYAREVAQRKFFLLSGVTGTGNSTLMDRLAHFLVRDTQSLQLGKQSPRKMEIRCAPQFDLEYHRQYIGHTNANGRFQKGELLKFWDQALKNPNQNYVCLIDNFDKINPETLFGPLLWQRLDDPKTIVIMGSDTIKIPNNFYCLSVTHSGEGQKIEMNNEHFKRFGNLVELPVNTAELLFALRAKSKDLDKEGQKIRENLTKAPPEKAEKLQASLAKIEEQKNALIDKKNVHQLLYFFAKTNNWIQNEYSSGAQLGQWSNVRKMFMPNDFEALQKAFINHVNGFKNKREMRLADFDDIKYSLKNEGSMPRSSPIWRGLNKLAELGFASELGVAGAFALISGLVGWFYFRRRHQILKEFTARIHQSLLDFNQNLKPYDDIIADINATKASFDGLVLEQKVNYNEATFFYGFIENKIRTIETSREVNQSFLKLMDVFLEDNHLSESEYNKLKHFLESMRYKIPTAQYNNYVEEIERIYKQFS